MINALRAAIAEANPAPKGLAVSQCLLRSIRAETHTRWEQFNRERFLGLPILVRHSWQDERFELLEHAPIQIAENVALACEVQVDQGFCRYVSFRFPALPIEDLEFERFGTPDEGICQGRRIAPFVVSCSIDALQLSRSEADVVLRHHLQAAQRERVEALADDGVEVVGEIVAEGVNGELVRSVPRIQQLSSTIAAMSAPMVSGPMRQRVGQMVDSFIEQEAERLNREALEWDEGRVEVVPSLDSLRELLDSVSECAHSVGESFSHAADAVQYAFQKSQKESKADKRAKALLLRHLTPEQARTYRATGYFLVQGSQGTVYRIRSERSINVETVQGSCFAEMSGNVSRGACERRGHDYSPTRDACRRCDRSSLEIHLEGERNWGDLWVGSRLLRSKRRRIRRKVAMRSSPVRCCLGEKHSGGHLWRPEGDGIDWESVPKTRDRHFCLEMPGCPLPDQLLAQKLLIEDDEADFIARAREWDPRTMAPVVPEHYYARCGSAEELLEPIDTGRLRSSWDVAVVRSPHAGIRMEPA